jgi:hypothetical protein
MHSKVSCRRFEASRLQITGTWHMRATPAQLRQLKDALAVSEAIQKLEASNFWQKNRNEPPNRSN